MTKEEKYIKLMEEYYQFHHVYDCGDNGKLGTDEAEALKYLIDTARKYQEIRKIYMTHHYTDEEVIEKIKEVIRWG